MKFTEGTASKLAVPIIGSLSCEIIVKRLASRSSEIKASADLIYLTEESELIKLALIELINELSKKKAT